MKIVIGNLVLTLAAYTDTTIGIILRSFMTSPIGKFDILLMAYIVEFAHF